jgi:ribose-phosphate pyrophosphokinase
VPYARQDRVCDKGESFSILVFADLINSMNFSRITIIDPHSAVTEAALRPDRVITQFELLNYNTDLLARMSKVGYIIAPDAGAGKKLKPFVDLFDGTKPLVCAEKVRDMSTGAILKTEVKHDDFSGRDVMMVDDICDGGRTFIEIAEVLKKKNVGKICLYVTHGIFSKGLEPLFASGIDEIFTTDSIVPDGLVHPNLNINDAVIKFST